jgi:hypothetical protein
MTVTNISEKKKMVLKIRRDSSVGTAIGCGLDGVFALGPNQRPIEWVSVTLSLGVKKLTTHLKLFSRSKKRRSVYPLSHVFMKNC